MIEIPVMHCFNDKFVIPAAVSFYSMLKNADPMIKYRLFVLHTDITGEHQKKLTQLVSDFKNASLTFLSIDDKFSDLFDKVEKARFYSKEMFYKFLAPSIFTQYDKIIITDVDVVFCGDISKEFLNFDVSEDYYLAGIREPIKEGSWLDNFSESYNSFSKAEKEKLITGGGYWIFNLKKMRADGCEKSFVKFAYDNAYRLIQPEQDTVNSICYPKIKLLHPASMACSYLYELYLNDEDFEKDKYYDSKVIHETLDAPIQLHYACLDRKPWLNMCATKADVWIKTLCETSFYYEYMETIKCNLDEYKKMKFTLKMHVPVVNRTYIFFRQAIDD